MPPFSSNVDLIFERSLTLTLTLTLTPAQSRNLPFLEFGLVFELFFCPESEKQNQPVSATLDNLEGIWTLHAVAACIFVD